MLVRSWVSLKRVDLKYIALSIIWIFLGIIIFYLFLTNDPEITIEWRTETEFNTVGFNIWRSSTKSGEFQRINQSIIPSSSDPVSGESYSYKDMEVEPGNFYYYQLEDIDHDGSSTRHDEVFIEVPRNNTLLLFIAGICTLIGLFIGIRSIELKDAENSDSYNHRISENTG